jgi:hypothetical protein
VSRTRYEDCLTASRADLTGRIARCACGKTAPSSLDLAFIEYRGPDSHHAKAVCKHCRYHNTAHDPDEMARNVPNRDGSRRRTVVEDGRCPGFEAIGPADFDNFYCGHSGWD